MPTAERTGLMGSAGWQIGDTELRTAMFLTANVESDTVCTEMRKYERL